jgi:hypothetical protein
MRSIPTDLVVPTRVVRGIKCKRCTGKVRGVVMRNSCSVTNQEEIPNNGVAGAEGNCWKICSSAISSFPGHSQM